MKCRLFGLLLFLGFLSACGGSPGSSTSSPTAPSAPATTTSFAGTFTGSNGQTGALDFTIQAVLATSALARPLSVSQAVGTLHVASGTTSLTGTFDSSNNALALTGGGYAFLGTVSSGGAFSGAVTEPDGKTGTHACHDLPPPPPGTYTINVIAYAPAGRSSGTSVCASYKGPSSGNPCVTVQTGTSAQIVAMASAGSAYTVSVPSNQQGSCSVESGEVFTGPDPRRARVCGSRTRFQVV